MIDKDLSIGTTVKISALEGLYKTSLFDKMIGIIVGIDEKEEIYQVYVGGEVIGVIRSEIIPTEG